MFLSKVPKVLLTPQLFVIYFPFVQLFNMVLFLPRLFKQGFHSFLLFISPLFSYSTWSFFFHACSNRDSTAFCYLFPLCSVIQHGSFSFTLVQTGTPVAQMYVTCCNFSRGVNSFTAVVFVVLKSVVFFGGGGEKGNQPLLNLSPLSVLQVGTVFTGSVG